MIKLFYLIILFVVVTISSCAISKKENERFEQQNTAAVVSDNTLLSDSVSNENLRYFEARAIQKLIDFYDYLNMLGHENYNETIRQEVRSSAERLFYDVKLEVIPYRLLNDEARVVSVQNLLKENSGENALPELDILNVEIARNLEKIDASQYRGILKFDIMNKEAAVIITKKAEFSLRKIDKKFGMETLRVWEVFLDQIL